MSQVPLGFIPAPLLVSFDKLLPSHKLPNGLSSSSKYGQIVESIRAIGLIEPLNIGPSTKDGKHVILDGHLRVQAMKQLGMTESLCLIATDDETYTYNNRIHRLNSVEEHKMLKKAIEKGVSPERLASSLKVNLDVIMKKVRLLDGICPEAVDLLKDQVFSAKVAEVLRKMKPTRQVECVELMISSNNLSKPYAEALLAASPATLLVAENKPRKIRGVTAEQMLKMEREMSNLQEQYKLVEESYGQDVLNLVLARGYLVKLLENTSVTRYIQRNQPDVLSEFANIVESTSLEK